MRARAHLDDDGRAVQLEQLAKLVLEVALVGKMQVYRMVEGQRERRRRDADLRPEENLDRVVAFGRLGQEALRDVGQEAIELAGGDPGAAGHRGLLRGVEQRGETLPR